MLQRRVVDELAFDPKVDSSTIAVTASGEGVVKLEGKVPTYPDKRAAEQATKRVAGVKAVAKRSAQLDAQQVHVRTEGGTVYLTGTVHSWDEAEDAAWSVAGVTDVLNELEVEELAFA